MATPLSISGFTALPITYSYPSSSKSKSTSHYIYLRAHQNGVNNAAKQKRFPDGRTLFMVNIPPDATDKVIISWLRQFGTIEKVVFGGDSLENDGDEDDEPTFDDMDTGISTAVEEEKEESSQLKDKGKEKGKGKEKDERLVVSELPKGTARTLRHSGQTAHIIFLDDSSLQRALSRLSSSTKSQSWPPSATSNPEPLGLNHYIELYSSNRPALTAVKQHADTFMELFEYERAKKKQESKYKKGVPIVDEEGFTLVTRGGAYGQTVGGDVGVASKKFELGLLKKKKKKKSNEGFYMFENRERKRKEFMQMRKKFEEDKLKVAKLKESRRFKPY